MPTLRITTWGETKRLRLPATLHAEDPMFGWLRRSKRRSTIPGYEALRMRPSRPLPEELIALEAEPGHTDRAGEWQRTLELGPGRPSIDAPLLMACLVPAQNGVLTLPLPGGKQCVPLFSSPFRAIDYTETLLSGQPPVQFLHSSPAQCARMLDDLRGIGVVAVAVDRCPRCQVFTTFDSSGIDSAERVIRLWSIAKGLEKARLDLYYDFACRAARAGGHALARDVALEAVGHVTMEDARLHVLLAQLAHLLADRQLAEDARAFLDFLKVENWKERLLAPI